MIKIDPKMVKVGKVVGSALVTAVVAFATDIENAQLKQTVKDLVKRVSELENK